MWIRQIGYRRQLDFCAEASLHGIKLPAPHGYAEQIESSPEDDEMVEQAMRSAMNRHVKERANG